ESLSIGLAADGVEQALALVVLWSRDEPARAGEVLLVPFGPPDAPWIFGRGNAARGERRVLPARQRPGIVELTAPIECPRISRAQLHLVADTAGALSVENAGRCPLVHDGSEVQSVILHPGDVVELRNELLLLCAARPRVIPALADDHPLSIQPF